MTAFQRYKRGIGGFISSEKGQRFFNFAYSIGAAVVIWGALFKILHLPGGNALLSIGMGTEVLMFVLTAFDRPPREYKWEEVFPILDSHDEQDRPDFEGGGASGVIIGGGVAGAATDGEVKIHVTGGGVAGGVASGAGAAYIPDGLNLSADDAQTLSDSIAKMAAAADQLSRMAELTSATQNYLDQMSGIAAEMTRLRVATESLNRVSDVLLQSFEAITRNSDDISRSSRGYVEQMEALDRNISGLNTIYEIQLKNVSSQIDAIDRVNRGINAIRDMYEKSAAQSAGYCLETEKMARNMQQLNAVYEQMLRAMTINMYRPMLAPGMTPDAANGANNNNGQPASGITEL